MGWIEILAVACGLGNIYLTVRQNIWCWPVGVVMVSLYIYIFYATKLYSDALLQIFFLAMQFYGWYSWTRAGTSHAKSLTPVRRLGPRGHALTAVGVAAGAAILGTIMRRHTDAALPYYDATTTSLSVFAQFLLTYKIIDNWILWIVADVLYLGIYTAKNLYWTAALYAVFLVLCIQGYREWKREI